MDIQALAQQLVGFLAPFLPYLLKAGEEAAGEAGKKFGAEAWEQAKALWAKLRPRVEARPAAQEAAQDVAANPQNEGAQAALRWQLEKLLSADQALAAELARLWEEAKAAGVTVVASGDRSVAIGGDVSGSTIVTGDRNVVQRGKYNVQIERATGLSIGDRAQADVRQGIVLIPVESSMVHAVGYDLQTRRLEVVFTSGQTYCYEDVPPEVFQGLLEAESKGRYMRAHIIDAYPYRRGPCPRGG